MLHQHALGTLALGLAGVDTADLQPGSAPASVMRQVLRESQAEREGLDTDRAAGLIQRASGQPLPDAVRSRMERAFGHDFSHVRVHLDGTAADAASSLNAVAFAIGRDLYFGRGAWAPGTAAGDELLAHELTHVVQADEGRLPSSSSEMDVSNPHDGHELEAESRARQVAQQLGAGVFDAPAPVSEPAAEAQSSAVTAPEAAAPEAMSPEATSLASWGAETFATGGGEAARATTDAGGTSQAQQPRPKAKITIAGQEIEVQAPATQGGSATATATVNREIGPGFTLRSVSASMDQDGNITGGSATADVSLGTWVDAQGVTLSIGAGGRISATVDNIPLTVAEGVECQVSLTVSQDRVSVRGELTADQIAFPENLGITGGTLTVEADAETLDVSGTLTGNLPGEVGTVAAETSFVEGMFSAHVRVELTPGFSPIEGVTIDSGLIEGDWAQGDTGVALGGFVTLTVRDWLTGEFDAAHDPEIGLWGGSGTLTQIEDRALGELTVSGGVLELELAESAITTAHLTAQWTLPHLGGDLDVTYDIAMEQLGGTGTATVTEDWPQEVTWGTFTLLAGGTATMTMEANEVTQIEGKVPFTASVLGAAETPLDIRGHVDGTIAPIEGVVNGTAEGELMSDLPLPSADGVTTLTVQTGSVVRGTLVEGDLTEVGMDLDLLLDAYGEPLFSGRIEGATYDVEAGTLTGAGTLTLDTDLVDTSADGMWTFKVLAGSAVTGNIVENILTEVTGDLDFDVDDAVGPFLTGSATGARMAAPDWTLDATLDAVTARTFVHPRNGEALAGWTMEVREGSGVTGTIAADTLTQAEGELFIGISDSEGEFADALVEATWDLTTDQVDGFGVAALARELELASGEAGGGWTMTAMTDTIADAEVEANALARLTGDLHVEVADEEGAFVDLHGGANYEVAEQKLDMSAEAEVVREKELATSADGVFQVSLQPGGGATATVDDATLTELGGTIPLLVRQDGQDLATVALSGTWTPDGGVDGTGQAELLLAQDVAEINGWHLWVEAGAGAILTVESSTLTEIGGNIPYRLDEGADPFIQGHIEATYILADKLLSGTGSATVVSERQLGAMASGDQLWLVPGSGATVTLVDNDVTQVGGNLILSTRDGEGEYATVQFGGVVDIAGGTGFTGEGGATVVRQKVLYETAGYSFSLMPGAGATAHIAENELTGIDGSVPFMVEDAEGKLIEGAVNGAYDPATGFINGTGAVYLGRTLEFGLGGTTVLKLLEGSGGDADVVDSQLTRVGGTLTAELHTDGSGLASITADGSYNVVTNTLEELTGTATLLRPFELFGGSVILSDVTGTGTIRDNDLVSLGGDGTITLPDLNNMEGSFSVDWSNESGTDVFEGSGFIDFTLFDDQSTGRSMSGLIAAELHADDTFLVEGEATYTINEMLKDITVDVSMDEQLDPELGIRATVQGTLVEARDLFGLEADLVPRTSIPIFGPFGIFFGLRGGMGMSLDALEMEVALGVSGWRPRSENSDVPTFNADLNLDWGMDFGAALMPYLGVEGSLGVAHLGVGLRGEVALNAPLDVNAEGSLQGGSQGFSGELGVGVRIAPTFDLSLTPFVEAAIEGLDPWNHDFDSFEQPLGEVFVFEWGSTYSFGDQSSRGAHGTENLDTPSPESGDGGYTAPPDTGYRSPSGGANTQGGPQLESPGEIAGNQSTGDPAMDQLMSTLEDIKVLAEGVGALGELVELVIGVITATAAFGPVGFIVYVTWKIFKGELSWDGIKEAVLKVVAALQTASELLQPHLPDWFNSIVSFFSGDKPGLLDALFGADDAMRDAVYRGDHRHAPPDMRAEMITVMDGGWVSEDDEECITEIIVFSAQNGDLNAVLAACGGASHILDVVDGAEDDTCRDLFDRMGIQYD